jgi:hypothetical protein
MSLVFPEVNVTGRRQFTQIIVDRWLSIVFLPEKKNGSDKMPLFCTGSSTICLWIRNGIVYGQYGSTVVNSTSPINTEVWTSLVFIYDESGEYMFLVHTVFPY